MHLKNRQWFSNNTLIKMRQISKKNIKISKFKITLVLFKNNKQKDILLNKINTKFLLLSSGNQEIDHYNIQTSYFLKELIFHRFHWQGTIKQLLDTYNLNINFMLIFEIQYFDSNDKYISVKLSRLKQSLYVQ